MESPASVGSGKPLQNVRDDAARASAPEHPTDIQLDGDANTCIYIPVKDGDKPPDLTPADFPDTCTLQ